MKDTGIQWHPGFVAAMNLELKADRGGLQYEREYNLNTKPLEIDLLIIKKRADMRLENEVGRMFRGHNILEYKDPADHLNVDVLYKVEGYAHLYKSYGETVDAIKADDITVTLIREAKPEGLFRYFKEYGNRVTEPYHGIYYVEGMAFPTQIVVTGELDWDSHVWLKALSGKLEKNNIKNLLENVRRLNGKADREFADSVLEVSVQANRRVLEEIIGDDSMSEALLEMMAPVIEPILQQREEIARQRGMNQGISEGMAQGIQGTISILREFGHEDAEIQASVMKEYGLSLEEAERYLREAF